ncbi:MAG: hypothetical protein M3457_22325 [Chloroflexota bacterium]|nr:hypothetical protein [Chloroflexota bacterium]
MRYLHLTSYGLTILGFATLIVAIAFNLNAMIQLAGLMLALAGIVKIVVVYLWTHVANLGSDQHEPTPPT